MYKDISGLQYIISNYLHMYPEHHSGWPAAVERASQFDLLLAAIPLVLAVGLGSGYLLSVPLLFGGSAIPAALLVAYGMYALDHADEE